MITEETPALVELLGESNVEKLRDKITCALIDEIESEINENYLLDFDNIRDSINSMINGILSSLKKKYKIELTEIIEAKFREELMR